MFWKPGVLVIVVRPCLTDPTYLNLLVKWTLSLPGRLRLQGILFSVNNSFASFRVVGKCIASDFYLVVFSPTCGKCLLSAEVAVLKSSIIQKKGCHQ
jgi:hypothetical protein